MIIVPAENYFPGGCVYRDLRDNYLRYLDNEHPHPITQQDFIRWLAPLPGENVYLSGEAHFASIKTPPSTVSLPKEIRLLPMPWTAGPVFVWYRHAQGVQLVAHGRTSGYGASNTTFSGSVPPDIFPCSIMIAAELYCQALLEIDWVHCNINLSALNCRLNSVPISVRAIWTDTLANVLLPILIELETEEYLTLDMSNCDQSESATAELRKLVRLEWASRIVRAQSRAISLAQPASDIHIHAVPSNFNTELNWRKSRILPLRAIRTIHFTQTYLTK